MKIKIVTLLILELLLFQACNAKHVTTSDKHQLETSALMIEALEDFISNTPYCALIQYTNVDVVPVPDPYPEDGYAEEKHIYHAKVLETYRGKQLANISFRTICQKGDDASFSMEPTVVTLCADNEGFFWPGTGAMFPATEEVIKAAKRIGQKFEFVQQAFPNCEWSE